MNRVGIANLPLLRIFLAICQESSFYHPNQQKNSHKLCNETGHLVLSLLESLETETTAQSEFSHRGKAIVKQILASGKMNKSKQAEM